MDVRRIAVLGAGEMGHGIAELAALKGFDVTLRDVDPGVLDRALAKIRGSLDKLAGKNQVTKEAASSAMSRIRGTLDARDALAGADLVVEAVPEDLGLKRRVLAEAERLAPPHAVLATNTSGIVVAEIAEGLQDPSRLVGMHFFNPVLLMRLVEVVPSDLSAAVAVEAVIDTARALDRKVVVCRKDVPGFVTTRLVGAYVNAGAWLVHHKTASPREVDAALRDGAGFPMGPLEVADLAGLDVVQAAGRYAAERLGPAYRPAPVVDDLVREGRLGAKSGRGFHDAAEGVSIPGDADGLDPAKVLAVVANEAAKLVEQGVATPEEVDEAMRLGCGFPEGPLAWADAYGLDRVAKTLLDLQEATGLDLYGPAASLVARVDDGHVGKRTGRGFHAYGEGT